MLKITFSKIPPFQFRSRLLYFFSFPVKKSLIEISILNISCSILSTALKAKVEKKIIS